MAVRKIAIIGGGISGLATAYELIRKQTRRGQPAAGDLDVTVFERDPDWGGNAHTIPVKLGEIRGRPDLGKDGDPYIRWCDAGVNDMNLNAYDRVAAVMRDIGYHIEPRTLAAVPPSGDTRKGLYPLENTECYFSMDGSVLITDDADCTKGIVDPRHSLQTLEGGTLDALVKTLRAAGTYEVYGTYEDWKDREENLSLTVGAFFAKYIADPSGLEDAAKYVKVHDKIDWKSPRLPSLIERVRDQVYYPRISAMYFADELGPEDMLLAAPIHYYCIQEGGVGTPDRRYFAGGSGTWIDALQDFLTRNGVHFRRGKDEGDARATVSADGVTVRTAKGAERFDACVFATHADHAAQALEFADPALEASVRRILEGITYTNSVSVCHTFAGVLPANRDAWRAYNVLVRNGAAVKAYSMTYVCNRHQNDTAWAPYDHAGLPQFFVTLNPQVPIPDDYILEEAAAAEVPDRVHALLPARTRARLQARAAANDSSPARKAIYWFRHNLIDLRCFTAQRALKQYHETATQLFFCGGWSLGSGLHEECFAQAETVAQRLRFSLSN